MTRLYLVYHVPPPVLRFFFFSPKISSRLSASLAEKSPTVKPPAPTTTTSKNTRGLYCLCFLLHVCGNGFWDSALASSEEPLTEDWKYQWPKVGRRCHAGFALNEYLIKNAAFQLSLKGYWALKLPGTMQEVVRGAKWSTPIPDRNTQKRILCFFLNKAFLRLLFSSSICLCSSCARAAALQEIKPHFTEKLLWLHPESLSSRRPASVSTKKTRSAVIYLCVSHLNLFVCLFCFFPLAQCRPSAFTEWGIQTAWDFQGYLLAKREGGRRVEKRGGGGRGKCAMTLNLIFSDALVPGDPLHHRFIGWM